MKEEKGRMKNNKAPNMTRYILPTNSVVSPDTITGLSKQLTIRQRDMSMIIEVAASCFCYSLAFFFGVLKLSFIANSSIYTISTKLPTSNSINKQL